VTLLREALALWRGPALPDLPDAHAEATRFEELRLAAVQDRIEAELALGGGPGLVPELRALLSAHPLSERLYGQLMRALQAGGRPAEALTVYEEARLARSRTSWAPTRRPNCPPCTWSCSRARSPSGAACRGSSPASWAASPNSPASEPS